MDDSAGHPRLALTSALTGALALIVGWTVAARLQPPGFDPTTDSISALAAESAGHRWVMTTALVITGLCHLVTAWALPRLERPGRIVLALAGVATVGVAAVPLPHRGESAALHVILAGLSLSSLAIWPWWLGRTRRGRRLNREYAVLALTAVVALGVVSAGWLDVAFGRAERVVTAMLVVWPVVAAALSWWRAGHRIASGPARRALGFAVVAVACALSGVAATAIAPITVETRHYSARVSLDPDPFASASVVASTVFGDIDMSFAGLAPGIRATPQIKASITDLLGRPKVSVSSLAPGPLELDAAVRDVGVALGLRFLAGALAVIALVVIVTSLRQRHWAGAAVLVRSAGAAALAALVTASSVAATYRPDQVTDYESTGLLSAVQANSGLLADVESRSAEVAPYLTNLVALTTALKTRYSPTQVERPTALRLLLVSDLHVGNQYPLARSIVEQEDIDAVVDSGDLVTFGTVEEGEAAGMFTGIESLGVPYFFVRGNHDATSPTDTALLTRLAKVPNVVLLQPGKDTFTEAELHGIRIRGVNDVRWFGDSGTQTWVRQQPAISDYRAAFAGQPEPDLLVSHHPVVARDVPAGVAVHGHMHSAFLERNRIQVGTFTGGGPLTHYVTSEDGGELTGQPSAFDILTFGTDCRAASLTRFSFRNLIEGKPAYDSVNLINGSQIDSRPADPARTCSSSESLRTTEREVSRKAPASSGTASPSVSGSARESPTGSAAP